MSTKFESTQSSIFELITHIFHTKTLDFDNAPAHPIKRNSQKLTKMESSEEHYCLRGKGKCDYGPEM